MTPAGRSSSRCCCGWTAAFSSWRAVVEKLECELEKSSRNSSRLPSSGPSSAPARGKDRSERTRGAQDGHEGHGRPFLPAWAVDEIIEHWPQRCGCGHVFSEDEGVAVGDPARHQVEELPPINVRVSEHRCQRVRCPECGRRTRAALPGEVALSSLRATAGSGGGSDLSPATVSPAMMLSS
jgi:transposase